MNNLKVLVKKLSNTTRTALEKSANLCISNQNYEIEIEHFFLEILNKNTKNCECVIDNDGDLEKTKQDILNTLN